MLNVALKQVCGGCSKWFRLGSSSTAFYTLKDISSRRAKSYSVHSNATRCLRRAPMLSIQSSDLLMVPSFSLLPRQSYASRSMNKEPKSKKGGKPKVHLSDEELSQIVNIEGFRTQLDLVLQRLQDNYVKQLSLRTSAGALESLTVEFEGEKYPLIEVGQVLRKNPNLVVINLSAMPDALRCVMEAIEKSGMNLNPQQEGTTIFVPIPQITREHRENLAKNAKTLFNQTKEEFRELQNRIIKSIKGKKGNFSDDLIFDSQLQIAAITETYAVKAETMMQKKQAELLGEK